MTNLRAAANATALSHIQDSCDFFTAERGRIDGTEIQVSVERNTAGELTVHILALEPQQVRVTLNGDNV